MPAKSAVQGAPEQAAAFRFRCLGPADGRQQAPVERHADFKVRVAEAVQHLIPCRLFPENRQVAGLEQQRLRADVLYIERRQQVRRSHPAIQIQWANAVRLQMLDQKRRRTRLEPVRRKLTLLQQQQHVEGVYTRSSPRQL